MHQDKGTIYYYADRSRIRKYLISGLIMAIFGGLMTVGYIFFFTDMIDFKSLFRHLTRQKILEILMTVVFLTMFMSIWVLPFVFGVRRVLRALRALRYARAFASDDNGIVMFEEITAAIHVPQRRILRDIRVLKKCRLIKNADLLDSDPPCILLMDAETYNRQFHRPFYLREELLGNERISSKAAIFLCILFLPSLVLVTLSMFVTNPESVPPIIVFCELIPMGLGLVLLLRNGAKGLERIRLATVYNQCLEAGTGEAVPISVLADKAGKSVEETVKDLVWMFKKQLMQDCVMDLGSDPAVRLSDVRDGREQFAAVSCDGCGGTARIRVGRAGQCPWCGRFLTAPKDRYQVMGGPVRFTQSMIEQSLPKNFLTGVRGRELGSDTYGTNNPWTKANNRSQIGFFAGGFLLFIFFLGLCLIVWSAAAGEKLNGSPFVSVMIFLVFGICGFILFSRGLRIRNAMTAATLFAYVFAQSPYQEMPYGLIARQTARPEGQVKTETECIRKYNLMKNIEANENVVSLLDYAHKASHWQWYLCGHCGGEISIRKGRVTVCRFCGAWVDENGLTHAADDARAKVILTSVGANEGEVTAYVHDLTGLAPIRLEELLNTLPAEIATTARDEAERICAKLQELGAQASCRNS